MQVTVNNLRTRSNRPVQNWQLHAHVLARSMVGINERLEIDPLSTKEPNYWDMGWEQQKWETTQLYCYLTVWPNDKHFHSIQCMYLIAWWWNIVRIFSAYSPTHAACIIVCSLLCTCSNSIHVRYKHNANQKCDTQHTKIVLEILLYREVYTLYSMHAKDSHNQYSRKQSNRTRKETYQ